MDGILGKPRTSCQPPRKDHGLYGNVRGLSLEESPPAPPIITPLPSLETPIPNSQPQRHQPDLTSSPIPPPSHNPPTPGQGSECLVENCKMPQHGEGVSPVHIQAPSHSSHLSPSPRASIPPSPLSTNTYLPNVPLASLLPVLGTFTSVARTLTIPITTQITKTRHTHHVMSCPSHSNSATYLTIP